MLIVSLSSAVFFSDFRKILGRTYEGLRKFLRIMKILGKTHDKSTKKIFEKS